MKLISVFLALLAASCVLTNNIESDFGAVVMTKGELPVRPFPRLTDNDIDHCKKLGTGDEFAICKECDEGYFIDDSGKRCSECSLSCKKCTSESDCSECMEHFELIEETGDKSKKTKCEIDDFFGWVFSSFWLICLCCICPVIMCLMIIGGAGFISYLLCFKGPEPSSYSQH